MAEITPDNLIAALRHVAQESRKGTMSDAVKKAGLPLPSDGRPASPIYGALAVLILALEELKD